MIVVKVWEIEVQFISNKMEQETEELPCRDELREVIKKIGIDFVDVAESHVLYFGRVKSLVRGELIKSNTDHSEFDMPCALESWLSGVGGSRFGELRSFGRLQKAHSEFHFHANEVLELVRSGNLIAAEQVRKSELSQSLRRVLITLTELNESIND